jgi:hypothetical protein
VNGVLKRPRERPLRVAIVLAAVALVAALVWTLISPPGSEEPSRAGLKHFGDELPRVAGRECPKREGPFGPGDWPSACWRPYSDSSPFNRPLPRRPRVDPRSRAIVARLAGFGGPQNILVGEPGTAQDYSHPVYWSQPGDPWFTIHCTQPWGRCALEGRRIQIPDRAWPAGASDAHLTVMDQRTGWEYDMWRVHEKPAGGGRLVTAWGGMTRIDGDGLGSDAVAAEFGTLAGKIRIEELEAGEIHHALFMFAECDSGRTVFPAGHSGRRCSSIGQPDADAPAMGQRFQLDMSDAEIDALAVPEWKRAILRAMAHYGMYLGDTGGTWGVQIEGGTSYASLGYDDPWTAFARKTGLPFNPRGGVWVFDLRSGIDWRERLRAIDPCEARGGC